MSFPRIFSRIVLCVTEDGIAVHHENSDLRRLRCSQRPAPEVQCNCRKLTFSADFTLKAPNLRSLEVELHNNRYHFNRSANCRMRGSKAWVICMKVGDPTVFTGFHKFTRFSALNASARN